MARRIIVYGHGDKTAKGFPNANSLVEYLEDGIFRVEDGRYRYTQTKGADVVVLAREGLAFGHFDIDRTEPPTDADRRAYAAVKKVYIVRKSVRYGRRVDLSRIGISDYHFGRNITERQFQKIVRLAGAAHEKSRPMTVQDDFDGVLRDGYERAGREVGYWGYRFLQSLKSEGRGRDRQAASRKTREGVRWVSDTIGCRET